MASKPKRKKKAGDKIVDERVPKLTGLMLLFISFFLGMSMISYLFTWSSDHDVVDSMSFFNFLGSGERGRKLAWTLWSHHIEFLYLLDVWFAFISISIYANSCRLA